MLLNEGNYYGPEAGMAYFSVSQYKSFMKCEAAAMAEIQGGYKRPLTRALLVGSLWIPISRERFQSLWTETQKYLLGQKS